MGLEPSEAGGCCDPVNATSRLDQVIDGAMRKTLVRTVGSELVPIECGQALTRGEPEKAARIRNNAVDGVARETFDGGEHG